LFISLSLLPVTFSLFPLSLLASHPAVRRSTSGDGPAPQRANLRRGYHRVASVSPSKPDRSPPWGHPELAGKPCFPTEVPSKPPELPAQNSPSFLHQIDRVRHQEPDRTHKRTSRGPTSSDHHALDFASRVSDAVSARICGSADLVSRDLPGLRLG
ncbi:hypothetical protein Prudu_012449, partial [Prunus dulcis]